MLLLSCHPSISRTLSFMPLISRKQKLSVSISLYFTEFPFKLKMAWDLFLIMSYILTVLCLNFFQAKARFCLKRPKESWMEFLYSSILIYLLTHYQNFPYSWCFIISNNSISLSVQPILLQTRQQFGIVVERALGWGNSDTKRLREFSKIVQLLAELILKYKSFEFYSTMLPSILLM